MGLVVGVDLGIKSDHDAVILRRDTSRQVGHGIRFSNTCAGRETLLSHIEKVRESHEVIDFVIDSPGRAWVPLAAMLLANGFVVYRPTADRVSKMRQAADRQNKTNRIDALALARCLLSFPDKVEPVYLPTGIQTTLDQLVRQRERLVDLKRRRKQRIQDLTIAINPTLMKAMGDLALTLAGRAFLRSYLDPRRAIRSGRKRLYRVLQKHYTQTLNPDQFERIFMACEDAVAFYEPIRDQNQMPIDATCLQEEMIWELDCLEREEQRLSKLEQQIKKINQKLDPSESFVSLPGIRHIVAGGIRSCVGDIDRFDSLTKHRGFAGLYPTSKGTGDKRASGTHIAKMSSPRYRRYLYLAAENAYKWDVECAAFYHKRRGRGHTHTQAVCAVANAKLLPRIHRMLKEIKKVEGSNQRRPQYVFRDLDGNPISKAQAKAIIQAKWGDVKY